MDFLKAQAARAGEAARHLGAAANAAARGAAAKASVIAGGSAALSSIGSTVHVGGKAYIVDSLLAEGGFGSVYAVLPEEAVRREKEAGGGGPSGGAQLPPPSALSAKKLVLKRMFAGSPELVAQLTAEVKLMQQLNGHPNIVAVLGAESRRQGEGADIMVLMELCPGGHLLTRMNQLREAKRTLPMAKILEVFVQIVRPIAHMHACSPPITHRDIKVSGRPREESVRLWPQVVPLTLLTSLTLYTRTHTHTPYSLRMCSLQQMARCACATLAAPPGTAACATPRLTAQSRRTPFSATPRPILGRLRCATCTMATPWTRARE